MAIGEFELKSSGVRYKTGCAVESRIAADSRCGPVRNRQLPRLWGEFGRDSGQVSVSALSQNLRNVL